MYPIEVKNITLSVYKKVKSLRKAAFLTTISKATISRWNNIFWDKMKNKSKCNEDKKPVISKINHSFSVSDVQQYLKSHLGIICSYELIRCVMKTDLKLSYKKTKYKHYLNEQLLLTKTKIFKTQFRDNFNESISIFYVDEVGFSSNQLPLYSWSKKGVKTYISSKIDTKNRKNKSVCSCISNKGEIKYSIRDKPYEKLSFIEFLKSLQMKTFSILVMDNVSFHHSKDVRDYCENQNLILIFTPPYSPWFNPIENVFSMIKHHYRKHKNIEQAFSSVSCDKILNCIQASVNLIFE